MRRSFATVLPLVALALALHTAVALAGSGMRTQLPQTGPPKHGLMITVDTHWCETIGYRPIFLMVETANGRPSPVERRLQVTFEPNSWATTGQHTTGSLTLPQGATSATSYLIVLQSESWHMFNFEVREQGQILRDLSSDYVSLGGTTYAAENQPRALFVDRDAPGLYDRDALLKRLEAMQRQGRKILPRQYQLPDVRGWAAGNPADQYGVANVTESEEATFALADDAQLLQQLVSYANAEILPPAQLPQNEVALSGIDLIFLSLDEAQAIGSQQPRLWETLRRWTASGGNLVVYGLGRSYERLDVLEKLLALTAAARQGDPLQRWQGEESVGEELTAEQVALDQAESGFGEMKIERKPFLASTIENPAWRPMRVLALGHGKVIALPEKNPFPGPSSQWQWLRHVTGPYNSWLDRTGLDSHGGDGGYFNYLIPAAGWPPVTAFRILITLFVIVIGPVNYWVLRRQRRLYLMLLTVPAGAGLVVVGLFLFALVRDGFDVQARSYSVTHFDQRAGLVNSWSRQTYFAGMAPSQGLVYTDSALVCPVYSADYRTRRVQQGGHRTHVWEPDRQRLAAGYLRSRSATQLLVADTTTLNSKRLRIDEAGDRQPLRVSNQLNLALDNLLVVDSQGKPHWAGAVGQGATAALQPLEWDEAHLRLKELGLAHHPQRALQQAGRTGPNVNYYYTAPGVLGQVQQRLFNPAQQPQVLPPRTYYAVAARPPQVPLGVDEAEEVASFHLITGRW